MADVPHKQSAGVTVSQNGSSLQVSYESSLPPPAMLKEYDQVVGNAAERYFAQFERQVEHRQNSETRLAEHAYRLSLLGMGLGFIVNIGTIGSAVVLALSGMSGPAIAAIVTAALANLTFFASFQNKK